MLCLHCIIIIYKTFQCLEKKCFDRIHKILINIKIDYNESRILRNTQNFSKFFRAFQKNVSILNRISEKFSMCYKIYMKMIKEVLIQF